VGFIVESLGGNTLAGADFLREAVKKLDLNDGGGADDGPPSPSNTLDKAGTKEVPSSTPTSKGSATPPGTATPAPTADRHEGEPLSRVEEEQQASPSGDKDEAKKPAEPQNTPTNPPAGRRSSSSQAGSKRPTDDSHDRGCLHDGSKRSGVSSCECRDSEKRPKVKKVSPPRDRKGGNSGGGASSGGGPESRRGKKGRRASPSFSQQEAPAVESSKQRKTEGAYFEEGVEEGYEGEEEGPQSPQRSDDEEGESKRDLSKRLAESDLAGPRPKAARTVIPLLAGVPAMGGDLEEGPLEGEVDLAFLIGDAADQAMLTVVLLVSVTSVMMMANEE